MLRAVPSLALVACAWAALPSVGARAEPPVVLVVPKNGAPKGATRAVTTKRASSPVTQRSSHAVARRSPGPTTRVPSRGRGRWAPVDLIAVNRQEVYHLRIADDRGRPIRGLDKRMSQFLRCHYTNVQHKMDPRLIRLLYETGRHYAGHRLEVVSGYRHPSVARNPKSPHMKGLACDFRVAGVSNTELRDYLRRAYKSVGVGYYPNSSFVHLDVRKNGESAFWIDYSRPKEDAIYSETPNQDLRDGRAESWKPTRIDPAWADSPDDDDAVKGAAPAAASSPPPVPAAPTPTSTAAVNDPRE